MRGRRRVELVVEEDEEEREEEVDAELLRDAAGDREHVGQHGHGRAAVLQRQVRRRDLLRVRDDPRVVPRPLQHLAAETRTLVTFVLIYSGSQFTSYDHIP